VGQTDEQFIHMPDELDDAAPGLICFRSPDRVCGADCMAYTTASHGGDELSEQQGHCSILVSQHRVGKHSVIIASMMAQQMKAERNARADKSRAAPAPVPPTYVPPVPHGR